MQLHRVDTRDKRGHDGKAADKITKIAVLQQPSSLKQRAEVRTGET
jgi:hypothetical protein